ncbi:2'-5' RNA ligase family protein [Solihabitans fulvus]|uniref:2'-5' RNA ligase family protein n=1 Tax=Solihabitans fulvus TaxID=1892852 RepID=A0A5B2XH18_9PSEU|nr:2'-5' RNA ligase family protein [Solihabitans fulvus]KAA2262335.1 2'-5' RNA ligase family protein [Solihabitans fulvus]
MAQGLVVFFDEAADTEVRGLWRRLGEAGVPGPPGEFGPHLTLAVAGAIPGGARKALRDDLALLSLPDLWLHTLAAFSGSENVLILAAVVDGELLAVHSAVHDVLAGKVKNPSAYYLPGSWVPHCTLASGIDDEQVVTGFRTLYPTRPIKAKARRVAIVDTRTKEVDVLLER